MCDDTHATRVHLHHSRVLIRIRHVLADILKHQLLSVRLHVCPHKRSKIQIRASIEVELVFEHLMYGVRRGAIVGDLEFRDLLFGRVACGVGGYVGGAAGGVAVGGLGDVC